MTAKSFQPFVNSVRPPTPEDLQLPLYITILCYTAGAALILILFLLLRINSRLSSISRKIFKESRSSKLAKVEDTPPEIEVSSGTRFEEFLNENPNSRALSKKEQFKAYRIWRSEKGLNWNAKD